ncbi:hypothetical protein TIFTF001_013924 [Ficus carica]|uniref:Uncharacterized protein n=1 Tax=Ficus carica TaxID=3494 RepID=A0AA88D3I1_FICCA|nr:hypothetical protein TIFTF001_013924 [Ficus carica]
MTTFTSAQSGAIKLGYDLKSKHQLHLSTTTSTISRLTHDRLHSSISLTQ